MEYEKEIKIRVENLREIESLLIKSGAELISDCFEKNYLFDSDGKLFSMGEALRLREACGKALLTFKGKKLRTSNYKVREEIEVYVSDFLNMAEILKRLGFDVVFYYEKKRKNFSFLNSIVSLDETPLGNFVEIEGKEQDIDRVAEFLGFSRKCYITKDYVQMALDKGITTLKFK